MPAAPDRRRSQRHWAAVPVVIRHGEAHIDGVTINLSEGGMYLFAATHLPLGSQLELEFLPPGAMQMVRISATVRRRALYLYGVEFMGDDLGTARDTSVMARDSQSESSYEADPTR